MSQARHRFLDWSLGLFAILAVMLAAYAPLFGMLPGVGVRIGALLITGLLIGAMLATRGNELTFYVLWAALGMAVGLGTLGIFSIGILFLLAALAIAGMIPLTPTLDAAIPRGGWGHFSVWLNGYLLMFLIGFALR
jgi:hypothetical protein